MKRPDTFFENPFAPDHLSQLTIETLPLDTVYYVDPGDKDDYEPPAIFINNDRRLAMSRNVTIDEDDRFPASPLELVGVMRTFYVDAVRGPVTSYVADTRFLQPYSLSDFERTSMAGMDQEEFMGWAEHMKDVIHFAGFLALGPKAEVSRRGNMPPAEIYGDPVLYPALARLRKAGDKRIKRFVQEQSTQEAVKPVTATQAATATPATPETEKATEKSEK